MLGLGQDPNTMTLQFPYSTSTVSTPANVGGNWWENLITAGASTGFNILRDVYGGVQPGTIVQSGPGGTTVIRQPEGYPVTSTGIPSLDTGLGSNGMMLLLGLGVVVVLAASQGGKN